MKLLKLEMNAFRGATQPLTLEFDPSRQITMIFGENGTGKSSISDALICLCTTDHGSLDDKSGTDKSFLVAKDCKPTDLLIQLYTDDGNFTATYANKKIVKKTGNAPPSLRHLRRSSIVDLVTAAPAKRYEQLAEYFDLPGIVKCENTLRDLVRNTKQEVDKIVRTLAAVENILKATWQHEGSPFNSWEIWTTTELQKDLSTEQAKLKNIRIALEAWSRAKFANEKLVDITRQGLLAAQNRQASEKILAEKHAIANNDPGLLPVLEKALHYLSIEHQDNGACPVCAQSVNHSQLLNNLQVRLNGMNAIRESAAAAVAARTEHERLQAIWQGAVDMLSAYISGFIAAANLLDNSSDFKDRLNKLQNPELTARRRTEIFDELLIDFNNYAAGKIIESDIISKALDQYGLIKENWKAVVENRAAADKTTSLQTAAEGALKTVESTRKDYIEAELEAISGDVDALYQALHPGENIGDVRLFLKEKGKNSLELTARFHNHSDIAPQSLYSESHLDTLALCIFFALGKRYGGTNTILLLDDVLSACDENHLDRFIQLLHDQAHHYAHILITTHYRPWRDRYRQQCAPQNEIHLLELLPWTPQRGIRHQNGKNDLQELQER